MNNKTLNVLSESANPLMAEKELLECLIIKHMFMDSNIYQSCVLCGSASLIATKALSNISRHKTAIAGHNGKRIMRLSNDLDFAITNFQDLPLTRSRNELNDFKRNFKYSVFNMKTRIGEIVKPITDFDIYTDQEIRIHANGEKKHSYPELHLYYKSQLEKQYIGHIDLEFTPRRYDKKLIEYRSVVPYALNRPITQNNIPTVKACQTFWDKCYALHVISELGVNRGGLSHHYYDVACMYGGIDIANTSKCLNDIIQYQQIYTTRNINPDLSANIMQLMPSDSASEQLSRDYKSIQKTFISYQESWSSVMQTIQKLNNTLHALEYNKQKDA